MVATTTNVVVPGAGELAFREVGAGSPLILTHGSPGHGRSWSRLVPRLAEHHRGIAPDLLGHGDSDPLPANTSELTTTMGAAICRLIDGCGAVRLGGHSYGGNVACTRPSRDQGLFAVLCYSVFFRALFLSGEQQAPEPAVRFFSAYADREERGESAAVAEMNDYWFGAGSFAQMHPSARDFIIAGARQECPRCPRHIRRAIDRPPTLQF